MPLPQHAGSLQRWGEPTITRSPHLPFTPAACVLAAHLQGREHLMDSSILQCCLQVCGAAGVKGCVWKGWPGSGFQGSTLEVLGGCPRTLQGPGSRTDPWLVYIGLMLAVAWACCALRTGDMCRAPVIVAVSPHPACAGALPAGRQQEPHHHRCQLALPRAAAVRGPAAARARECLLWCARHRSRTPPRSRGWGLVGTGVNICSATGLGLKACLSMTMHEAAMAAASALLHTWAPSHATSSAPVSTSSALRPPPPALPPRHNPCPPCPLCVCAGDSAGPAGAAHGSDAAGSAAGG
jgi:hypothetical protein